MPHGFLSPQTPGRWCNRVPADLPPKRRQISAGGAPPSTREGCVSVDLGIPSASLPRPVGEGGGPAWALPRAQRPRLSPTRAGTGGGSGLRRETRHLSRRHGEGTFPFNYTAPLPVSSLPTQALPGGALGGAGSTADKIGPESVYKRHLLSLASCCRSSKFMWNGESLAEREYNQDDPEKAEKG